MHGSRRRRATHAVAALLAVGTLAGCGEADRTPVAGRQAGLPSAGSTPVPASVSTAGAEEVVRRGHLYDVASNGDRVLSVWQRCDAARSRCRYAWRRSGDTGAPTPVSGSAGVTATGERFVLWRTGTQSTSAWVVDRGGSVRPVADVAVGAVRPGDVVVGAKSRLTVVDPRNAARWPLSLVPGVRAWASAAIGAAGDVWALAAPTGTDSRVITSVALWHSSDGSTWTRRSLVVGRPDLPGYVVTSGRHVAALATYDGATVLPVGELAVTADGRTWHDLARRQLPFEYVDTMAATSGGTLFVVGGGAEGGGRPALYRTTDEGWTRFERVELPTGMPVAAVRPAGPAVVVESGSWEDPALAKVDDSGRVTPWTTALR